MVVKIWHPDRTSIYNSRSDIGHKFRPCVLTRARVDWISADGDVTPLAETNKLNKINSKGFLRRAVSRGVRAGVMYASCVRVSVCLGVAAPVRLVRSYVRLINLTLKRYKAAACPTATTVLHACCSPLYKQHCDSRINPLIVEESEGLNDSVYNRWRVFWKVILDPKL